MKSYPFTPWARPTDLSGVERMRFPQPVCSRSRNYDQLVFGLLCACGGMCLAFVAIALVAMAIEL